MTHILDLLGRLPVSDLPAIAELIERRAERDAATDRARRIALVGLRGAGKSTLGRAPCRASRLSVHRARPPGRAGLRRAHPRSDRDRRARDLPPLRARLPRARHRRARRGGDRHRRRHRLEPRDLCAAASPHPHGLDQGAARRAHAPRDGAGRLPPDGAEPRGHGRPGRHSRCARRRLRARARPSSTRRATARSRASRNSRGSPRVMQAEQRSDARRPRLPRSRPDAARIPHDRAAPGCGADARAAARGARLGRRLGQLSGRAGGRDRRRRVRLFARRLRPIVAGQIAAPVSFMHEEARDVLPRVLDAIGFRRGLLVGHSDGASIAAIYAGSVQDHRVRGLALMAPHFFTEDMGLAEIARAKVGVRAGRACAPSSRGCTPISTTPSTAGAAPGSIPNSASGT